MVRKRSGAFVCGHPIAHSRSPVIHRHWLEIHGIDGTYEAVDVAPKDFAAFLKSLPDSGYAGGNVTIPHKEATFALVDRRDEAAEAIGAVNTVWIEDGRICGGNSDAPGFAANLDEFAPAWRRGRTAVLLGAGGAARAVLFALRTAGYSEIRIVNRTFERARELADHFGSGSIALAQSSLAEAMADADLLVNTTSLGMKGELAADPSPLPAHAIVTDIVYVPLETPLLAFARRRGLATVDGLGMLLHQAVPGFEKWFGVRPVVTSRLREVVLSHLGAAR
jgi:shikimate dehydrogenase